MGNDEHRWARVGLASFVALFAAPLLADPLDRAPAPAPPAQPCPSASPSARPADLALVWVDVMGVARSAFPEASREVVSLLDRMGVRATVRLADARAVSTDAELTVIVLPGRPRAAKLHHAVMGATHRSSDAGRALWVYADGVAGTLGLERRPGAMWWPLQRRDFAVALGRVVAHEVVHAVAPRQPHVRGGLMAEQMGRALLLTPHLEIDAATVGAFREGLVARPRADDALAALPESLGGGTTARP